MSLTDPPLNSLPSKPNPIKAYFHPYQTVSKLTSIHTKPYQNLLPSIPNLMGGDGHAQEDDAVWRRGGVDGREAWKVQYC